MLGKTCVTIVLLMSWLLSSFPSPRPSPGLIHLLPGAVVRHTQATDTLGMYYILPGYYPRLFYGLAHSPVYSQAILPGYSMG
jgi:hypothetical protein